MVLVDDEIQARALTGLITPFDPDRLINCRYNLRAGCALSPDTGEEISPEIFDQGRRQVNWRIKPSETLMIMTREAVKMPPDLMATYGQLNHLAQQGLLLVNASIVEPGYNGHLSCFLVNFSKNEIDLSPDQEIAKLCFYSLTKPPAKLVVPKRLSAEEYKQALAKAAAGYPLSFLDIGKIEKRVTESVSKGVNDSIKFGGKVVVFLLFFAALEPLASRFFWERIGVSTATTSQDVLKLRQDIAQTKNDLDKAKNDVITAEHDVEDRIKKGEDKVLANRIDRLEQAITRLGTSLNQYQKENGSKTPKK